jgi:hypothetical protein
MHALNALQSLILAAEEAAARDGIAYRDLGADDRDNDITNNEEAS